VAAKHLQLWDSRHGNQTKCHMSKYIRGIMALTFSPGGTRLITVSTDTVTIWKVPDLTVQHCIQLSDDGTGGGTHIAASPDTTRLAIWGYDGAIRIWKFSCNDSILQLEQSLTTGVTGYDTVAFGRSGEEIAWAMDKHTVRIQPLLNATPQEQYTDLRLNHRITLLRYTPDGTWLFIGCGNGTIQVYNAGNLSWSRHRDVLLEKDCYVTCMDFSMKNQVAVGCGRNVFVYSYNQTRDNLELSTTLKGHRDRVESVSFHSDGQGLVSGGDRSIIFSSL
jgi:WD40 repeat protein